MKESRLAIWIKWLVYTSVLMPLVISAQYLSPFHFGKVIFLRSIVEVMVALYLILIWRDRSYLPKSHPITWAFLSFTSAFTITSFFSVAWLQSLWGTLERMGGLFTFWPPTNQNRTWCFLPPLEACRPCPKTCLYGE